MFGVDFSELALIFIVALVVLGPTRLPGLVRTVGHWMGKARSMARQFREQLENEMNLEELNRMTEARTKEARAYPPPPPEFGGEPMTPAATEPAAPAPEAGVEPPPASGSYPYSPEADAQSQPAEPEYVVPPPGDASHNDLSEGPPPPQDPPHGRVA